MVGRAQIIRPVEGPVLHQGWLHPALFHSIHTLFPQRAVQACAPYAVPLGMPKLDSKAQAFFAKLWPKRNHPARFSVPVWPSHPLPFDSDSQALVWSPLWLHHVENPLFQVQEWLRVLKPQGGVFFSCFGPDTAQELRGFAAELGTTLPDFPDMHDLGDLLGQNGFSDPVMEMEKLTLTYSTPHALLADFRALLGRNVPSAEKGLLGKGRYAAALNRLAQERQNNTARIPLTLELIYGHAWKVPKLTKPAVGVVKLGDIGGRKQGKTCD